MANSTHTPRGRLIDWVLMGIFFALGLFFSAYLALFPNLLIGAIAVLLVGSVLVSTSRILPSNYPRAAAALLQIGYWTMLLSGLFFSIYALTTFFLVP